MAKKKNTDEEISVDNLIKRDSGKKKRSSEQMDIIPTKKHNTPTVEEKKEADPNSILHKVLSFVFAFFAFMLALIFVLSLFGQSKTVGSVGLFIFKLSFGLFGHGAWALPLIMVVFAIWWRNFVAFENCRIKIAVATVTQIFLSSVIHVFFIMAGASKIAGLKFTDITKFWKLGYEFRGGGVIGGFFGTLFKSWFGSIAWVILFILIFAGILLFAELTPVKLVKLIKAQYDDTKDERDLRRRRRRLKKEKMAEKRAQKRAERERRISEEIDELSEDEEEKEEYNEVYEEPERPKQKPATDIPVQTFNSPKGERAGKTVDFTVKHSDGARTRVSGFSEFAQQKDLEPQAQVSDTDKPMFESAPKAEPKQEKVEEKIQAPENKGGINLAFEDEKKENTAASPKAGRYVDLDFAQILDSNEIPRENERYEYSRQKDAQIDSNDPESADIDLDSKPQNVVRNSGGIVLSFGEGDGASNAQRMVDNMPKSQLDGEAAMSVGVSNGEGTHRKTTTPNITRLPNDLSTEMYMEPKKATGTVVTDSRVRAPKQKYRLPPVTLLQQNTNKNNEDITAELQKTGKKLVEVLRSFHVETEIVNISYGPTITRYELSPKVGVKVRSISNLIDDISLNMESGGVRIEAPIPGKAAVGIEVPNKKASIVYLRELIENPSFAGAKSKITAALGMDVSGTPIYFDVAKMPHLLIAGATGMGKSVCINSIIVSLLYRATPEELKLILIDPKKVELTLYNKLPHLLVPVVTSPKKAAGALAWACTEMENRFEIIEAAGVRDIEGYNAIAKDNPDMPIMPKIVIIIDELADLMLTAPGDVEDSICRLAQKARAAGMHLLIGTQRPSVDVITGLIKANIPSRIAFTVASQVDSRTIIDIVGAEKLIGRGDMLFAPVGAMKPIRVQGAFVSDKEVNEITEFIRSQGTAEYDEEVINMIDKEAEQCGQPKRKGGAAAAEQSDDGDDELDPRFWEAVKVAVDMKKISTSLLQRTMSLGYGRAAKIIDAMQKMGIVTPQDGAKAREVLIDRAQYDEMMIRRED